MKSKPDQVVGCERQPLGLDYYGMVATQDTSSGSCFVTAHPLTFIDSEKSYEEWLKSLNGQFTKQDFSFFQSLSPRDVKTRLSYKQKLENNAFCCKKKGKMMNILYHTPSWFNHSCVPNAIWTIDPKTLIMTISALNHVKKGEQIFLSYNQSCAPRFSRLWLQHRGIDCKCLACSCTDRKRRNEIWKTHKNQLDDFFSPFD